MSNAFAITITLALVIAVGVLAAALRQLGRAYDQSVGLDAEDQGGQP